MSGAVLWSGWPIDPASAIGPENVLLLYHDDGVADTLTDGEVIRDHYLSVHGAGVRTLGLAFDGTPTEEVTADLYLQQIRQPILDSGLLTEDVDVIVTTRGLPLRIDNGLPGAELAKYSSLESELTRIDTIDSIAAMQDGSWILADIGQANVLPANPYYKGANVLNGARGSVGAFSREEFEGIRLTSRLDGYNAADVISAIDRASGPIYAVTRRAALVIDDDTATAASSFASMRRLYEEVLPDFYPDSEPSNDAFETDYAVFEPTPADVLTSELPVIGYVGHGTASGLTPSVPGELDSSG